MATRATFMNFPQQRSIMWRWNSYTYGSDKKCFTVVECYHLIFNYDVKFISKLVISINIYIYTASHW